MWKNRLQDLIRGTTLPPLCTGLQFPMYGHGRMKVLVLLRRSQANSMLVWLQFCLFFCLGDSVFCTSPSGALGGKDEVRKDEVRSRRTLYVPRFAMSRVIITSIASLLLSSIPLLAGQQTIKVTPTDRNWKASVEAAVRGSIFAFEPGVYHDCGVTLNSGEVVVISAAWFPGVKEKPHRPILRVGGLL